MTMTFDLLTPKVDRFLPLLCGSLVLNSIKIGSFVFIARQRTDAQFDIAILSVRPSVHDVPVSDEIGLTYCHSFFTTR